MNWVGQIAKAILDWLTGIAREDKTVVDSKINETLKNRLLDRIDASERLRDASNNGPKRDSGEAS